eukprot:5191925-Amphidinium_carterae.1
MLRQQHEVWIVARRQRSLEVKTSLRTSPGQHPQQELITLLHLSPENYAQQHCAMQADSASCHSCNSKPAANPMCYSSSAPKAPWSSR